MMRTLIRTAAALLVVAGLIGGAVAVTQAQSPSQTKVTVKVQVTPNKAGTKRRPQGVKIKASASLTTPPQFEPPITQRVRVFITKHGLYNGAKFPSCSESRLNRAGPSGCPKGSIMGKATGEAFADQVVTRPKITIVNGGARRVYFYTVLNNPARVMTAVEGKITRLRGHPKYGYRVDVSVPQVLQVVAGVPIQVTKLSGSAGRGDWLATTGCPKDRLWRGEGTAYFDNGGDSGVVSATVRCRP